MNILIEADAFKVNGEELANLAKTDITKFVTLNVGETVLPDLVQSKNEVQINNKIKDEYDDNIL